MDTFKSSLHNGNGSLDFFCSYYVDKMKRCLSSHWQLSLLHYSETFNISWQIESVNHLLDLKWKSLLNSSFVSGILAGGIERENKRSQC